MFILLKKLSFKVLDLEKKIKTQKSCNVCIFIMTKELF
jgi:hypothetical protein